MNRNNSQSGFSAIELLITVFVAAAFFLAGNQLYTVIIKDSGETRLLTRANNVAYDYIQRYIPDSSQPCSPQTPLNNQPITVTDLVNTAITIDISCPSNTKVNVAKITATLKYGSPQRTVVASSMFPTQTQPCPTGFIRVPGSLTYGTDDFCIMKYEAKNVGGTATSQNSGTPWVTIAQSGTAGTDADEASAAACTGCHLITEAEWMTIAQNVLSVSSNWSGESVGSGYIYSGHNDGSPNNAIEAGTDDSDGGGVVGAGGYYLTGDSSTDLDLTGGMVGKSQRRTLTLTNGEVIWDFAGNVLEWTAGQISSGKPGVTGETEWEWREWTSADASGSLSINPFPSGTALSGSINWDSSHGIGKIYSVVSDTALNGFLRGGTWYDAKNAGVLALALHATPDSNTTGRGFRVAR